MSATPELFYGLRDQPFMKSTPLKAPFMTIDAQEAEGRLACLKETRGIGVFIGIPGSGKTSILKNFAGSLNPALYKLVYIPLTSVSVNEFLKMMAVGLNLEPKYKKSDLFGQIQDEIQYQVNEKRCIPVFIIDEAQYLPIQVLRDLVMLLNFDMDSKDYCILLLAGTEGLKSLLKRPACEAFRQRILVKYQMNGMNLNEAREYVKYILDSCGAQEPIFSEAAVETAYRCSRGSVRKLNNILSKCLQEGARQRKRLIENDIVESARQEIEF